MNHKNETSIILTLSNDLWEDVHTMHGNHHVFVTCKFLCGTRPYWLVPENDPLGNLQYVKWLWSAGHRFDEDSCRKSASEGHLEILRWLHVKGCPWDEYTCESAAGGGHLEVLQWARANGCPWDKYTCIYAKKRWPP